jgi:carbon monoxide dehydrogenase subunit G
MEITGTQVIPAPRSRVWDALNDPSILKACLPGCESVERTGPEGFKVVVAAAIGPLRARFNGALKITEAQAPQSCVMVFEGQGGAVGFGKGSSSVDLRETADGTELSYSAKAQVGGKLAQVGSRLIDSVAKKMSDDFFESLRRQMQPPAAPEAARTSAVGAETRVETPADAASDAAPVAKAPAAPAAAPASTPASTSAAAAAPQAPAATAQVPAWWLAVAVLLGSLTTLAGGLLLR